MQIDIFCIKKPQLFVGALSESVGNGNYYDAALNAPKNVSSITWTKPFFCFDM
jgi:hypothetical protein